MSTPDPQQPKLRTPPTSRPAAAPNDRHAKISTPANPASRGGSSSDQASLVAAPMSRAPDRPDSQQPKRSPRSGDVSAIANGSSAAASNSDEAIDLPTPRDGPPRRPNVPERQGHSAADSQDLSALLLWDPVLQTLAAGLDDVESTRIAQANRYRILTTTAEDSDGETRGFGLSEHHPAVAALATQLQTLEFLDKQMAKALAKQLRAHPLYPWVKGQKGLGDKTVARLLAAVRDPYWNDLHGRPRTLGELFAFCGVAGPGQRRARGQKVNWSPEARKRVWIMTGPIIRGDGPYRAVYDAGRERYADKVHTAPCAQCGKKGTPAETGSEWRDGHKHAGAIRLVMREILRDLWTESRAFYEATESREALAS